MTWWTRLVGRRVLESQLDAELRDHVQRQVADYVAAGMSEPDARRRTRLEFGGLDQVKDQCRDVRGTRTFEELVRDVHYALRVLRKSPGFTIAAIASLALGIGANTAIFSLIDAAMLKSLPVREPERLIELLTDRGGGNPFNAFSYPALEQFRDRATTLDGVIASHSSRLFVVVDHAPPELGAGQYVTGNFFPVLGVPALVGRTMLPSDDHPGAEPIVVLSHAYWLRRFGADPLVAGRRMTLDGLVFTIVGVAPPGFRGVHVGRTVDVWIPLSVEPRLRNPSWTSSAGYKWLQIVGRVRGGATYEQARAELQTLFRTGVVEAELALSKNSRPDHPARTWRLAVEHAGAGLTTVRQQFSEPLFVLLAVSGLVLVIACVNVANLLLARASTRRHEIAVRLSLGAGRPRVMRQLLTESLLLSSAGALLGMGFAYAGCRYLLAFFATSRVPVTLEVGPDARVLAFTATLAIATGLLFGLAPAWRTTRPTQGASLMDRGRVRGSRDRRLLSRVLIGGQVALSVMMLVCAGLFLRSLHNVRSIETGFNTDGVLVVRTDASRSGLTVEAQRGAFREALTQLAAIRGVLTASLSWVTPIEGGGSMRTLGVMKRDGEVKEAQDVHLNWVSPDYFATIRTPIRMGRDFAWHDTPASPKVATSTRRSPASISGRKARSARESRWTAGRPKSWRSSATRSIWNCATRCRRRSTSAPSSRNALPASSSYAPPAVRWRPRPPHGRSCARSLPRSPLRACGASPSRWTPPSCGSGCSACCPRCLPRSGCSWGCAVGLYGVMSYMVASRTSEIGIRMALGARPSRISGMVVREALMLTAAGVVTGIAGALLLSRTLASLLFGLTPRDPLTLWSVIFVMLVTGLAAAYFPSRRAARLDPTVALRQE